jgi:hypothetical protein
MTHFECPGCTFGKKKSPGKKIKAETKQLVQRSIRTRTGVVSHGGVWKTMSDGSRQRMLEA